MKTHIAYPGLVTSRTDGQDHFIGFRKLCELYGVPPASCVDGSQEHQLLGRNLSHLIPIRPRFDGQYPALTQTTPRPPRE